MQTAARRLVVDPVITSRVTGVIAANEAGDLVATKPVAGVLLASGGFCRNAEMVRPLRTAVRQRSLHRR